jgi:NTP pyrophosphatase (non-canonical NTP hydrolase)
VNLTDYTYAATRTESRIDNVTTDITKLTLVANMFIHAGNLLDMIKKNQFYGKSIDIDAWNAHVESLHKLSGADGALLLPVQTDLRTSDLLPVDPRIFHGIVGVATEGTELVEALMKAVSGIKPIDLVNVQEECIDACWYIAILHDATQLSWEEGLERNIAKLKKRYPDKFNVVDAVVRDLDAERKILEGEQVEMTRVGLGE